MFVRRDTMRRWVPTWFLIVTILTTASGQIELSPTPCTPFLLSQVLASTINSRNDWPDQTVRRYSEQVVRADPLFAGQDPKTLLSWHITPRNNGCVVGATARTSGIPVKGNAFYV